MTDAGVVQDLWADGGVGQLLGCGHVAAFAGVCQYQGCAKRLCPNCVAACETCGTVLCRAHQVWVEDRQRVFCSPDARRYRIKWWALRVLGWDHHD